jgi:coproporphyrinogen III oxidase
MMVKLNLKEDLWERPEAAARRTRNRERKSFEKGGVNISAVHGKITRGHAKKKCLVANRFLYLRIKFNYTKNPMVPTVSRELALF